MAMISRLTGRIRPSQTLAAAVAATLVFSMPSAGGQPAPSSQAPDSEAVLTLGDSPAGLADLDARGQALPTADVRSAAAVLGADVRWNAFGTPASILPRDGSLGSAGADPVTSARAWLRTHRAAFGLTAGQVDRLELVNNQAFARSSARAVLFRQTFGTLSSALDGQVTVGIAGGKITYVSSSVVPTSQQPPAAELTPVEGWRAAARDVGRTVAAADVDLRVRASSPLGWNRMKVPGFAQEQLVRLRALPLADGRVRPVFEANVVDTEGGNAFAYTLMVDAVTGRVLHRQNQVEHSNDFAPFNGTITATACGPKHPVALTDDNTRTIQVTASAVVPTNDIVVKLWSPSGQLLASQDTGTSPEPLVYTSDRLPKGVYAAQVCPYDDPPVPFVEPGAYAGTVATSDLGAPDTPTAPLPRWRFFPANPTLDWSVSHTPRNSVIGCWNTRCTLPSGPLEQPWGPPWDTLPHAHTPSFTTVGNNALTHEAWLSPLTPGGLFQAPVSPTREYTEAFTDQWNNKRCNPANLVPAGNDINAVTGNLFVAHNRMHDYSYGLGFTERNYNMQADNLGRNPDPTRAADPEIGNVQAGAIGGLQSGLGRDNANQITLQDGVPGITNQYLFQPIAGAFYAPCADGSLDMSIVGHEYTHAISNRMVGGPDEGLSSEHGGAMGESWSDLVAAEYMFSHGYSTGASPWVVGPYATGNRTRGIRDYAISNNPLNFGDYGFDSTGDEVHADGEIWNGTMWDVRQALVRKWNSRFPYTNRSLQLLCAQGSATRSPLPAGRCPGNRRWVQLMFDSFLLQQGATSMLDARDALLAADRMRFGGANQTELWNAFARRGMGSDARTPNADSGDVIAGYASPKARNGTITFVTPGANAKLYVGHYEARVTPVADTSAATVLDNVARFAPGRYRILFQSPGRGFKRLIIDVAAGEKRTITLSTPNNLAAKSRGASVIGSSPGSINTESLIDGTESTNWAGINDGTNVDAANPFVSVDLAGGVQTVRRVQVSAMLRPAPASPTDVPLATDPDSGSRFTALRRFALEACVSRCSSPGATWKRFYTSSTAAFPAVRPRPVAPNLNLRGFDVPDVRAAAIRLVALENQCTGYSGYAGEQDDDPLNDTDCKANSDRGQSVRAAELQVY